jgi:hypothetical protein
MLAFATTVRSADIKNWPKWMQPNQSKPALSTPASPAKAMDCSQCTSATVITKRDVVTGKPGHGFRYVSQIVHQCDGCRDTLARMPGTKAMKLAHACTAVGEKALCCATQPGRA